MVEIGGRPILWHIMKIYAHHGFRDFVLCLGYRGNDDQGVLPQLRGDEQRLHHLTWATQARSGSTATHHEQDFSVTLADTGQETMTGGRVKRVARLPRRRDLHGDLRRRRGRRRHLARCWPSTAATASSPRSPRCARLSRFGVLDVGRATRVQTSPRSRRPTRLGQRRLLRLRAARSSTTSTATRLHPRARAAGTPGRATGSSMAYHHDGFLLRHGHLPRVPAARTSCGTSGTRAVEGVVTA